MSIANIFVGFNPGVFVEDIDLDWNEQLCIFITRDLCLIFRN